MRLIHYSLQTRQEGMHHLYDFVTS